MLSYFVLYKWKEEGGRWRVEGGGWKVEGGRWREEGAGWKEEGAGWKVEGGCRLRVLEMLSLGPGDSVCTLKIIRKLICKKLAHLDYFL